MIDVKDPGVEVAVKGTTLTVTGPDKQSVKVEPGDQELKITSAGLEATTKSFSLKKGETKTVTVSIVDNEIVAKIGNDVLPLTVNRDVGEQRKKLADQAQTVGPKQDSPPAEQGFVPLFNGKDLTAWQESHSDAIDWTFADGVLMGKNHGGPGTGGFLFTNRADYADFHLRCETMLSRGQNAPVSFRSSVGRVSDGEKVQYTANIAGTERPTEGSDKTAATTGNLAFQIQPATWQLIAEAASVPIKVGEWFKFEVVAKGPRIQVFVKDKKVVDYVDVEKTFSTGSIGFGCRPGSTVVFRKIELKDLTTASTATGTGVGVAPVRVEQSAIAAPVAKKADYDVIATGKWTRVLPGETDLQSGDDEFKAIVIPKHTAGNVIIRARVKKVSGQNLSLALRQIGEPPGRGGYGAWFNGEDWFGMWKGGRDGKDLGQWHTPTSFDDYFELAFSAVGETLTIYADGTRIGDVRDPDYRAGSLQIRVRGGRSLFQNVEIMILDKSVPSTP